MKSTTMPDKFIMCLKHCIGNQSSRALASQYGIPYQYFIKLKNGDVNLSPNSKYVDNFASMLNMPKEDLLKKLQQEYLTRYCTVKLGLEPIEIMERSVSTAVRDELCRSLIQKGLLQSDTAMPYVSSENVVKTGQSVFVTDNPEDSILPGRAFNRIICTTEKCEHGKPGLTILQGHQRVLIYSEPLPPYELLFFVRGCYSE